MATHLVRCYRMSKKTLALVVVAAVVLLYARKR